MIDVMLQDLNLDLKQSDSPVIKPYYIHGSTKILAIGLKDGVTLAKHKAPSKAQLLVVKGKIVFKIKDEEIHLDTCDTFKIPLDVEHEVIGKSDAIFLLILSEED
jgi:quercetin dioxygenase-like cupin family protein